MFSRALLSFLPAVLLMTQFDNCGSSKPQKKRKKKTHKTKTDGHRRLEGNHDAYHHFAVQEGECPFDRELGHHHSNAETQKQLHRQGYGITDLDERRKVGWKIKDQHYMDNAIWIDKDFDVEAYFKELGKDKFHVPETQKKMYTNLTTMYKEKKGIVLHIFLKSIINEEEFAKKTRGQGKHMEKSKEFLNKLKNLDYKMTNYLEKQFSNLQLGQVKTAIVFMDTWAWKDQLENHFGCKNFHEENCFVLSHHYLPDSLHEGQQLFTKKLDEINHVIDLASDEQKSSFFLTDWDKKKIDEWWTADWLVIKVKDVDVENLIEEEIEKIVEEIMDPDKPIENKKEYTIVGREKFHLL